MTKYDYSHGFFEQHVAGACSSARAMLPIVLRLMQPRSVVDVGCGIGAWLSVFRELGIEDVYGIDGAYVDRAQLLIPERCFMVGDLEQPIQLPRHFDLVVSLEVAEHLSPAAADVFVSSLIALGPVILFSAAIPGQGGEHHVNERWPGYWAAKFAQAGFTCIDCIRPHVWNDPAVEWWYAQNTFLYVHAEARQQKVRLQTEAAGMEMQLSPIIHPRLFAAVVAQTEALRVVEELLDSVPVGAGICLVDDYHVSDRHMRAWRVQRLMEREGVYSGTPPSAEAALEDLAEKRREGAQYTVITHPAFWWLERYPELRAYLESSGRRVLENQRVVVFEFLV